MKVFVTGGAGFLGSHICRYYREQGADVVAYDNFTKHELARTDYDVNGAREYMKNYLESLGVKVIIGDILDMGWMMDAASGSDYICHCAAQPAMTIALQKPEFDAEVNIVGTINVLELARILNAAVVNCSTIHVYGNGLNERIYEGGRRYYREVDTLTPEDYPTLTGTLTPLHASKFAGEIYTRVYAESYGVKAATFRLTGMYGPNQFGGEDHGWVANFAIRTVLGMPITVYKSAKQVRDIIYVDDAVDAFVKWYEAECPSGIYNICGGWDTETSLGEVLEELARITRLNQDINIRPVRQGDLLWFVGNNGRALTRFGWRPKTKVAVGLESLVRWIKDNINLFKQEVKTPWAKA